ncbi:AAA family ATPase [Flavihumibacter solisilvae]|uniref:ATPase AAA n=1 Tax=Flavihumibacter solisilvae TaxID=1349421 RepID=A0A0C1LJ70_9BACT|nr:AAA family ATPase [Flavihumibacter solisilvae]KIC95443.1 ATPase AAA [Flavihumibacter solisilvae]
MDNLFSQKVINANSLFDSDYLDSKMLYLHTFNQLPSIHFINFVDGEKVFGAITAKLAGSITAVHRSCWYRRPKKRFEFSKTIILFNNQLSIELDSDYCEILHNGQQQELLEEIIKTILPFKAKQRRQPLEINLIVQSGSGFELKAMEIKRTSLDLGLFYADDFKPADEVIQSRLRKKNDKGVVLLHGLPGTGKTSYIRYLIGRIKKRVLFLSPTVAGNLMNPEFIDLLIDNPNTVLIVEDAENIIMDRRQNSGSSVSNLLNISDGLLADFLNVQLVCTFNNALAQVDHALLRKGRLIARYEFGKLPVPKAQRLSDHLGFRKVITAPMTVAEIANPEPPATTIKQTNAIGFRQQSVLVE